MLDRIALNDPEILEKFPNLNELMKKVNESPNIKGWMEKRPKTKL